LGGGETLSSGLWRSVRGRRHAWKEGRPNKASSLRNGQKERGKGIGEGKEGDSINRRLATVGDTQKRGDCIEGKGNTVGLGKHSSAATRVLSLEKKRKKRNADSEKEGLRYERPRIAC